MKILLNSLFVLIGFINIILLNSYLMSKIVASLKLIFHLIASTNKSRVRHNPTDRAKLFTHVTNINTRHRCCVGVAMTRQTTAIPLTVHVLHVSARLRRAFPQFHYYFGANFVAVCASSKSIYELRDVDQSRLNPMLRRIKQLSCSSRLFCLSLQTFLGDSLVQHGLQKLSISHDDSKR